METVAQAKGVKRFPYREFGACVDLADTRHHAAPHGGIDDSLRLNHTEGASPNGCVFGGNPCS